MNAKGSEDLVRELQGQLKDSRMSFVHERCLYSCLLATVNACIAQVAADSQMKILATHNEEGIFGQGKGSSVRDLFTPQAASQYFDIIQQLTEHVETSFQRFADEPWQKVFPSAEKGCLTLENWVPWPADQWEIGRDNARVKSGAPSGWHLLTSPGPIIGPEDDFRVEYHAQADAEPQDLSVIVGQPPQKEQLRSQQNYPDKLAYSFVFGGIGNTVTEIRRNRQPAAISPDCVIRQGQDHHCVAERVGGVIRFIIDGRQICRTTDALPYIGEGYDHVSLYTWGSDHTFRDVSVFTRPTSISRQIRERINSMRRVILETSGVPARFVEAYYLGNYDLYSSRVFMFKDVTETIEERRRQEVQRQEAEKMALVLQVAGAAAHELNQPLTSIVGHASLVLQDLPPDAAPGLRKNLEAMTASSFRAADILKKMAQVDKYRTKQYVGKSHILDIDASSTRDKSAT